MSVFKQIATRALLISCLFQYPTNAQNSEEKCCEKKLVGDSVYMLAGLGDTSTYDCFDGCTYHMVGDTNPQSLYCFKPGNLRSICQGVCQEAKGVSGTCPGFFPSWTYDQITNRCEKFTYSGCQGNGNRFASKEECDNLCRQDCCHYANAGGKNYTLLKHDNPDCSCTYRLDNDYNTTNPQQFCYSNNNSTCLDDYLAENLCKEIGAGNWKVYNWWQAISPCFSKIWGVGDIDSSLCMKSPSPSYQLRVDEAVDNFKTAVDSDPKLTRLATSMWTNVPEFYQEFCPGDFHTYIEYLRLFLSKWPQFKVGAPTSSTLVCYIHTQAGREFFANNTVNKQFTTLVNLYEEFLDSPISLDALNKGPFGWLSPCAQDTLDIDQFKIDRSDPYFGFQSFNDFFHRNLNEDYPYTNVRPIAGLGDDKIIVSPGDLTVYHIEYDIKKETQLYIKNESYSLFDIFAGDNTLADYFVGGSILQGFFHTTSYHWFHAPVEGTIIHAQVVPGLLMALSENNVDIYTEGQGDMTEKINYWLQYGQNGFSNSQLYLAHVSVRGIVIIESQTVGKVCALAIGMEEVSSVTLEVKNGQQIKKGEPLGYFQYGGSSGLVILEKKNEGKIFGPFGDKQLKMGQKIMEI